jgi:hypothetical protein
MPVTVSSASYALNSNEVLTLCIAAYAAIISTFLLGWDAYKWLASGAKINLSASTHMRIVGGAVPDPNTYISVTAINVGDRPTTISNLGGMYFESWWRAYITRKKPKTAFIITEPSQVHPIPYRFEIGAHWMGIALQTDDIVLKARNGYLFFILYSATGGRGQRIRIRIRENVANDAVATAAI